MRTPPSSFSITNCGEVRNTMIIWPAFWRMDMEFHKGMSSSGKLYGFLPDLATLDEDCTVVDELLTAGVICCTLDEDIITHIETSEELDSGIYRSI